MKTTRTLLTLALTTQLFACGPATSGPGDDSGGDTSESGGSENSGGSKSSGGSKNSGGSKATGGSESAGGSENLGGASDGGTAAGGSASGGGSGLVNLPTGAECIVGSQCASGTCLDAELDAICAGACATSDASCKTACDALDDGCTASCDQADTCTGPCEAALTDCNVACDAEGDPCVAACDGAIATCDAGCRGAAGEVCWDDYYACNDGCLAQYPYEDPAAEGYCAAQTGWTEEFAAACATEWSGDCDIKATAYSTCHTDRNNAWQTINGPLRDSCENTCSDGANACFANLPALCADQCVDAQTNCLSACPELSPCETACVEGSDTCELGCSALTGACDACTETGVACDADCNEADDACRSECQATQAGSCQ
jgi:hypothetical protein